MCIDAPESTVNSPFSQSTAEVEVTPVSNLGSKNVCLISSHDLGILYTLHARGQATHYSDDVVPHPLKVTFTRSPSNLEPRTVKILVLTTTVHDQQVTMMKPTRACTNILTNSDKARSPNRLRPRILFMLHCCSLPSLQLFFHLGGSAKAVVDGKKIDGRTFSPCLRIPEAGLSLFNVLSQRRCPPPSVWYT